MIKVTKTKNKAPVVPTFPFLAKGLEYGTIVLVLAQHPDRPSGYQSVVLKPAARSTLKVGETMYWGKATLVPFSGSVTLENES